MHRNTQFLASCIALMLFPCSVSLGQVIYNPATQWDATNNPSANGPWTYGYKTTLTGSLTLFDTTASNTSGGVLLEWYASAVMSGLPNVAYNSSGTTDWTYLSATVVSPGEIDLHPGALNQMPVLRFTAPQAGTYTFAGNFNGDSTAGTTTNAYLQQNGTTFYSIAVTGFNTAFGFNETRSAVAGDTFDFVIDYGNDLDYSSDSTGLFLTVSAIPEPSTYGIFTGLVALGLSICRRRVRAD